MTSAIVKYFLLLAVLCFFHVSYGFQAFLSSKNCGCWSMNPSKYKITNLTRKFAPFSSHRHQTNFPTLFSKLTSSVGYFPLKSPANVDITTALIAVNAIVFFATMDNAPLLAKLAKHNRLVGKGELYRLLSATFAHASMPHILMNMYSLYNVGYTTEKVYGSTRYVLIYLLSGVAANYATYLLNLSPISIGASASVYGVLGALGTYYFLMSGEKVSAERGM